MKKLLTFLLILTMLLSFAACTDTKNSSVLIPEGTDMPDYSQTARNLSASFAWGPRLEEGGLEHYDYPVLVADVTITGWLDEFPSHYVTICSAKVNNVLAGDYPYDTIVISLAGSTEGMYSELPLVNKGERLIVVLVLYEAVVEDYIKSYYEEERQVPAPEWVTAEHFYSLSQYHDVVEHDGEMYVLDRDGIMTELVEKTKEAQAVDVYLKGELVSQVRTKNSYTQTFSYPRAYKYDDFAALVEKYAP